VGVGDKNWKNVSTPAFVANAELDIQLHGGIGYIREHAAHLRYRRTATLRAVVAPSAAECRRGGRVPPVRRGRRPGRHDRPAGGMLS
jgi:hypothetical protein